MGFNDSKLSKKMQFGIYLISYAPPIGVIQPNSASWEELIINDAGYVANTTRDSYIPFFRKCSVETLHATSLLLFWFCQLDGQTLILQFFNDPVNLLTQHIKFRIKVFRNFQFCAHTKVKFNLRFSS